MLRGILLAVVVVVIVVVVIEVVAVDHTNPPVATRLNWDSPQTEQLATVACMDCHSNETRWPWYSNIPPFSFLIMHDVQEGRQKLNFSQITNPSRLSRTGREVGEQIQRGSMPPTTYVLIHRDAALTPDQKQALIAGLEKTLSQPPITTSMSK